MGASGRVAPDRRKRRWLQVGSVGVVAVATAGCPAGVAPEPKPPESPELASLLDEVATALAEPAPLGLDALARARWVSQEGTWRRSFRFEGGRYTASGYPPWEESGKVEVVAREGQRLLLRFSERFFDGTPDEPIESWIEVAPDRESFDLAGHVFRRQAHDMTVASDPVPTSTL
jgi:hypothetical protein